MRQNVIASIRVSIIVKSQIVYAVKYTNWIGQPNQDVDSTHIARMQNLPW